MDVYNCLQGLVSNEDNENLTKVPTIQEVRQCVFSMKPESAAGPDCFGGGFYQSCWEVIKDDLLNLVRDFFQGKALTRAVTHTAIVLIPKVSNPATFAQFRPISLSNYCNKIITKIMVTMLSNVLIRVVSPYQAGFVKDMNIIDNILLAEELCHGITASNEDVVLKLDMTKAYDRMSWKCVTTLMRKMGFSEG
ncbi:uncharacterized protein LOC116026662 [Ipomoea triloba]|uniref:uncharacterized protein LOC116026662 n=1 Tax=Ipomoea triloba TaxID=35885 RepID=UPI00125DB636|nr:uncharacterized protein LOC116026662 [Ipomoea triloba]XP_031123874.1 uncharacterized protein LOC116026662 [Ipomoea triloba]XP_031123875.1 uncharacterized protein LOC116026662 [Ipomoea triloba]